VLPAVCLVLSICFLGLSVIILYAEIAHVIGIQNNIIYNIVTVPTTSSDTLGFISSTVIPSLITPNRSHVWCHSST